MPTIKNHIAVVEAEINAIGKRLETEELTADQLSNIADKMAKHAQTLNWLKVVEQIGTKAKGQIVPIGGGKSIIH